MWKTLLITLVSFVIVSTPVNAQEPVKGWANKPIQCDTLPEIINVLKKYNEMPILGGVSVVMMPSGRFQNMPLIWFLNREKDTWTVVEWNTPLDQACIIASGAGAKFNFDDLEFLKDLTELMGSNT